jgi:hypothetical protein
MIDAATLGERVGWFLVGAMAVFRIAHVIAIETGPFAIFAKFREATIRWWGYESWKSEFFRCPLCMGFWLSLAVTLIIFAGAVEPIGILLLWLGMSGFMTLAYLFVYNR